MSRRCESWMKSYLRFVEETESPTIYHRWCALSVLSGAMQKKCYFELGRIHVYPNIYVILVGPPGARKSEAIKYGQRLLNDIETVSTSSDSTTVQAFLQDIAAACQDFELPNGEVFRHSSLSIVSRELEIFLKQKQVNHDMLALLTDVYDAPEEEFSHRTKHAGSDNIPSVFVSMLAATTPESIANMLPIGAVGSGFTSRIMFIHAAGRGRKIAIPEESPELVQIREDLLHDLNDICCNSGIYRFTKRGKEFWETWYEQYDEHSNERICLEPSFIYWYERKPMQILKVAQLIAASYSNELAVTDEHMIEALKYIEESEGGMGRSFVAVGRSSITAEFDIVMSIVEREGFIKEPQLLSRLGNEMDTQTFDSVMQSAIRSEKIKRLYAKDKPPAYKWIG